MTDLLTPALAAAERGWPVFMLGRSKRPVANCETCQRDQHDPAGCGHLTCHGFYAASTDPAHGGTASLTELVSGGLVPRTLWVVTGSGGQHLYYRHPGQHMPSRPMPGRAGIDIKADGGYVVLPPSIHHRTRRPYQWGHGPADVVEMPPALVSACLPDPAPAESHPRPSGPVTTTQAGGISHPDRLLTAHLDAVRHAPEGRRRTTLYGAARGVARMVAAGAISHTDAIAALTDAGQQAEQTARDIHAAITGGFRDEGIAA